VEETYIDVITLAEESMIEGISDMFGVYVKSKLAFLDWEIGDRRLSESNQFSCYTNGSVINATEEHDRGRMLGHWFYLCVNGNAPNNIPAMDIAEVMELVYEALPNLSESPDFPDLGSDGRFS